MAYTLDFEKPLADLDRQIQALQKKGERLKPEESKNLDSLKQRLQQTTKEIYEHLTPWQTVQVARHPGRPHSIDYVKLICDDFFELRGDRAYGENASIFGGPAQLGDKTVMFLCQEKGREMKERRDRNAGQPHPEGFRKAHRLMEQAEKFKLPLVCLVDTPGASIALDDEERGQSQAIAANLYLMAQLRVPIIAVVIGEGGSGGALALSIGDRILMLENSYYSVASPESAATILLRDAKHAATMAEAMQVSARQLKKLGIIDELIREPLGGAHQNYEEAAKILKEALLSNLTELQKHTTDELLTQRYQKYRSIGPVGTYTE
ncbi:acetyl-CoA carboxylase carboxyltransferase subunit alpha [Dictyobacter kobayashii]|uniref:Acetyl-coenzyme A carboxylase carboxyl transferase subunit alpha n=1 Tax=Dictyobacter kobayashii TaxID=2014872 RepID=A0A402AQN1_9CHLR|nr:acetyl-CoA carboxylase carboxyltransferase subunit alpha [Dictyobacter kobayashii]GCE21384.1 acetyl-coenzyme A carboxylase carboxyl transferase subunit alpha [Dictyobacter kobayashii]